MTRHDMTRHDVTRHDEQGRIFGLLAEFDSARDIFSACEQIRDAGYTKWDSHTPYPVHNLDKAMGLGPSRLPWLVLAMGLLGGAGGLFLQTWTTDNYPIVASGMPSFSWQAFVPIAFELMILFAAFGAVFGLLGMIKLPQYYHSLFHSKRFERVTDDSFFISIEEVDPKFDLVHTTGLLEKVGATYVEAVEV